LVPATMKNAANCDTSCELQNSVNHQIFERKRRSRVFLGAHSLQCRLAPKSTAFLVSSELGACSWRLSVPRYNAFHLKYRHEEESQLGKLSVLLRLFASFEVAARVVDQEMISGCLPGLCMIYFFLLHPSGGCEGKCLHITSGLQLDFVDKDLVIQL